ncbi:integrase core domain-containing protein [Leptospira mtsangambouensis]|uniref:integrase core domain-containing protein n=1 Tax=Leptospira mtsangambouensis TaxID=2484912 RepID=UPI001EEABF58|nr:integrase core domain-containing protein [Leptospira mtsangambouensis]MCG6138959.1 integrase core domain-containing protein [Leptospira mtsangambouensis]
MVTLLLCISLLLNLFFLFGYRYLLLKITFLKSQLTAYKRKEKVFHTKPKERILLILISYLLPNWESSLILVSPNTLLKWRKKKFQLFWKLLSQRKKPGRPNIPWDLIKLIRRLAKENRIWGATKLHGILIKLGLIVSERTVSRYIPRRPIDPRKRLSWNQFYNLHSDSLIVSDLFSVISYNLREIYKVIFFMDLQTRKILYFDVHTNPTTSWVRRVIKFAFRKKGLENTSYLITDNDVLFGKRFTRYLERLGIKHKKTTVRSPWQNGYAERFVKTCRNEFLNYFIPINEYHLQVKLEEFIHFYNHNRTHLALNKETPVPSQILHKPRDGNCKLESTPVLGGLYHTYSWKKSA